MKRVIALVFIVLIYLHSVQPIKKKKPKEKVRYRHGKLKVVFGGCFLIFVLLGCVKPNYNSAGIIEVKCSNWTGTWFCFDGDSIIKDSIVLSVKYYGIRNNKNYVQYKSNTHELDTLLWHYCPYQETSDDIHIVYKGKNMYFRYYH